MFRIVLLLFLAVIVVSMALALILTVLAIAAIVLAIGVPMYFLARHWLSRPSLAELKHSSIDRLQSLYVDGKIDIFEFERRVAQLITVENR